MKPFPRCQSALLVCEKQSPARLAQSVLGGSRAKEQACIFFKVSIALTLSACVSQNVIRPLPAGETITARAAEACSRRMAQLAAPYRPKGLGSFVLQDAAPLPNNRYLISLLVSIDYPSGTRTARVHCVVNEQGRIESISAPR